MAISEYLLHCILLMLTSSQGYGHILRLPCKKFADFRAIQKSHALEDGWVIRTIDNTNVHECQSECLKNEKCKSFNSYKDGTACELNSRSAEDAKDGVITVPRSDWSYMQEEESMSWKEMYGHVWLSWVPMFRKYCHSLSKQEPSSNSNALYSCDNNNPLSSSDNAITHYGN